MPALREGGGGDSGPVCCHHVGTLRTWSCFRFCNCDGFIFLLMIQMSIIFRTFKKMIVPVKNKNLLLLGNLQQHGGDKELCIVTFEAHD